MLYDRIRAKLATAAAWQLAVNGTKSEITFPNIEYETTKALLNSI